MTKREVVVVAVVVACVAGVALPTVSATQTVTTVNETDETVDTTTNETVDTTTNGTGDEAANTTVNDSAAFGDQLTAFMQSNAAETNDTVESGMWNAAFDHANESEQARLATERTGTLEKRLEHLQQRNETLNERYENGSLNRTAYLAQSSQLSGQMAALRTSINDTERAASGAGVNETRLETLRNDARNMTGPQVSGVARGVVAGGQGPPHTQGNGPAHAQGSGPPGGDGPPGLDNSTGAGPHNETRASSSNPNQGNETSNGSVSAGENAGPDGDAEAEYPGGQGNENGGQGSGNSAER